MTHCRIFPPANNQSLSRSDLSDFLWSSPLVRPVIILQTISPPIATALIPTAHIDTRKSVLIARALSGSRYRNGRSTCLPLEAKRISHGGLARPCGELVPCRCLEFILIDMSVRREQFPRILTRLGSRICFAVVTAMLLTSQAASAPLSQFPQRRSVKFCPPSGLLGASFLQPFVNEEFLDLSNCGVVRVEPNAFRGFHSLKKLTLAGNTLHELHPDTFVDCPVLSALDLSGNVQLSPSPSQPFLNSPSLEVLDLRNCGIEGVFFSFFQMVPNLVEVNLHDNPLCNTVNCDNIDDIIRNDSESEKSNFPQDQIMKLRKTGRTLLMSEKDYFRWSPDPQYSNRRQKSSLLTILVVGTIASLSVIGVGMTVKIRAHSSLKRDKYNKLRFDPEEIVISSERENSSVSHRTTWKQQMELMYVLLTYSSEYGVCPVKM